MASSVEERERRISDDVARAKAEATSEAALQLDARLGEAVAAREAERAGEAAARRKGRVDEMYCTGLRTATSGGPAGPLAPPPPSCPPLDSRGP
jgi:hypothetical protein